VRLDGCQESNKGGVSYLSKYEGTGRTGRSDMEASRLYECLFEVRSMTGHKEGLTGPRHGMSAGKSAICEWKAQIIAER
jgi:hypothetical protein